MLFRLVQLLKPARACVLALLIGGLGGMLQVTRQPVAGLDNGVQDAVLGSRTPESYLGDSANTLRDPRTFITIVAIDERTLDELGAYNGGYPRAYHAQVIENLLAAPPRVIALDLGFFEPTPDDALLAAALDHARQLPVPTSVILAAAGLPQASAPLDASSSTEELAFDRDLEPVSVLADRSRVAFANVVPDERGTIRGMPLVAELKGAERPSLGLAAVAAYLRRPGFLDWRTPGALQLAGRSIPIEANGFMRINFFGPPSRAYSPDTTFRVISFVDVLRGRVDPAVWRGGLVFVGALGATGLADDYWTPSSRQGRKMAGVEIHANAAATLFSMNFLRPVPDAIQFGLCVVLSLILALLALRARLLLTLTLGPLLLLVLLLGDLAVLYVWGWLAPIVAPLLCGVLAFIAELAPRLVGEQRQARAAQDALDSERRHDTLTGLANRRQLMTTMRSMVDSRFALLVLDLDNFKDINDTLGHAAGDTLLQSVARRLTLALSGTGAHIARLGGDEFAIVLPGATSGQALATCESLRKALDSAQILDGRTVSTCASIGIALSPQHGEDADTLLRRADAAMYAAKSARGGYAIYSADHEHSMVERLAMVTALRNALSGDELRLHYQPKVECETGCVVGLEALVRWQHPDDGLIAPDRFVPLAEQTGLIRPLTAWVLETATRQLRTWLDQGMRVKVAVNLSAHDLQDPGLPAQVFGLLDHYEVPYELLSLEITETALLADPTRALRTLTELAERGVTASLDDFGTGYSSLTYLRQLPLHELKIDASFVGGMSEAGRDRAIVRSTIELGHRLGLDVVAEGVEDQTTLDLLAELGCDHVQGYFLSRPLPADSVADWLQQHDHLESRRVNAA